MTRPRRYLFRQILFLIAVGGLVYMLHELLLRAFHSAPLLIGVIIGCMLLGIIFILWRTWSLEAEVSWLESFRDSRRAHIPLRSPHLLAPMAAMLGERRNELSLSPVATRALLDGISLRLDESREISRYAIGLLIFLGLLGTFWGLLQTIAAVSDAISSLQVVSGDSAQMFARLKENIAGPLRGMSTAFGASLVGLAGSLVLGFIDLQLGQAQNRFFNDLDEWLSGVTRISGGSLQFEGEQPVPAYVEALLERTAESIDDLQRSVVRSEERRGSDAAVSSHLADQLGMLAESLHQQQNLLLRMAEADGELRNAINLLASRAGQQAGGHGDEASRAHLRNVEAYLARLLEETVRGRTALADELRGEFKLLARSMAARPTMATHQPPGPQAAAGGGARPTLTAPIGPAVPPGRQR
jgi:hypothetical protein